MAQKLTLTAYLWQRGKKAKALTKIEAQVFGIAYPLQAGWPRRHGAMEITEAMLDQVAAQAIAANQATVQKIRRSAKRAAAALPASVQLTHPSPSASMSCAPPARAKAVEATLFPGFILRNARRLRTRRSPPWT